MQLVYDGPSSSTFPFIGEWRSKTFFPSDKTICFRLDVYSSGLFFAYVQLLTDSDDPITFFNSSNAVDQARMSLVTEVQLVYQPDPRAPKPSLAQLVVYLSANTILNNVSFTLSGCPQKSFGWSWSIRYPIFFNFLPFYLLISRVDQRDTTDI